MNYRRAQLAYRYLWSMHIPPELGIFWRSRETLQIGLDARCAVVVEGLSGPEQELVSFLNRPRTEPEIDRLAAKKGIDPARVSEILVVLGRAGILANDTGASGKSGTPAVAVRPETASEGARSGTAAVAKSGTVAVTADPRVAAGSPTFTANGDSTGPVGAVTSATTLPLCGSTPFRARHGVRIETLDVLGVSIGLMLARAGIRRILFSDQRIVGPGDHPLLYPRWEGASRAHGFLFALRQISPDIATRGVEDIAVVTGSRIINPHQTYSYMNARLPHVLAWTEDIDIAVGPLVEPYASACAGCVYQRLLQVDPAWHLLLPQVLGAAPVVADPASVEAAAGLVTRAVLAYLEHSHNTLRNHQIRVPPLPGDGCRVEVSPHAACGCTDNFPNDSLPTSSDASSPSETTAATH